MSGQAVSILQLLLTIVKFMMYCSTFLYSNLNIFYLPSTTHVKVSLATVKSYESWTVRERQNQKYAYGHEALIPLILLASSYR